MAIGATIFKVTVQLADMDRQCYATEQLTLARHPSETDQRMMIRLLVYGLNYTPQLQMGKGVSATDEADLWHYSHTGELEHWIELGQPSPERIRKAMSRCRRISIYTYGDDAAIWWQRNQAAFAQLPGQLAVWQLDQAQTKALAQQVERNMLLTLTIVDGQLYVNLADHAFQPALQRWL